MTLTGSFRCWECRAAVDLRILARRAVLKGRRAERGGPYYLLQCPSCGLRLKLEEDRTGRRVVSPASGPSLHGGFDAFHSRPFAVVSSQPRASPGPGPHGAPRAGSPGSDHPRGKAGGPSAQRGARAKAGAPPASGRPATAEDPFCILGVPAGAGKEAVEKAFREQAKRCHPDRFADLDEEFRALAHQKFIRLREAYEAILATLDLRGSRGKEEAHPKGRSG